MKKCTAKIEAHLNVTKVDLNAELECRVNERDS